jgi:hypothetical protein
MLGGSNAMHLEATFLPKFVSTPITLTQSMASDGTLGADMLEVA